MNSIYFKKLSLVLSSLFDKALRRRREHTPSIHQPEILVPCSIYGSDYGGWPIVDGTLNEGSVVYSFGVGRDITFDIEIIKRFGCNVFAFDPTPKSRRWILQQELPPQFKYEEIGIGASDGIAQFFEPSNSRHVSYSKWPGVVGAKAIQANIARLSTIMKKLDHDHIDVLKMDIEGFEYDVIDDLCANAFLPKQLLLEFHHGLYGYTISDTIKSAALLKAKGYSIFYVSPTGREYAFLRT